MDTSSWFYDSASDLARIGLVGVCSYVALVVMLRTTGKRTLSKMNMFDWVITVAMGSVMANALSATSVLAETVAAFAVLIGMQYAVTWVSVRSEAFENLVDADPTILYFHGRFYEDAMRRERVPKSEILSAIRQSGQGAPEEIAAVILESNGELIVMNKVDDDQTATLEQAGNWESVKGRA